MVQVELHLQVGRAHRLHDGVGLVLAVQEEAGDVAGVDRLDQHLHAVRRGLLRRPGQVGQVAVAQRGAVGAGGHQAGHHMDALAAQRRGVRQRLVEQAATELVHPVGQAGQATLAGVEVAGRGVEQRLRQAMLLQPRRQFGSRYRVRE